MKKEDLKKGTRIYYNGDQANEEGHGVITGQFNDGYGDSVDVKMDDGRTFSLSIVVFSDEYKGHGGTRWVTEEAYEDFRQVKINRIEAELAEKDAKRSTVPDVTEGEAAELCAEPKKESRARVGKDPKEQITEEDVEELRDEDVPTYAIGPFTTALLVKIARGDVDMKQLAMEELENRGINLAELPIKKVSDDEFDEMLEDASREAEHRGESEEEEKKRHQAEDRKETKLMKSLKAFKLGLEYQAKSEVEKQLEERKKGRNGEFNRGKGKAYEKAAESLGKIIKG